jgi:glycosyltransferase involved in cell wall biosynthesis
MGANSRISVLHFANHDVRGGAEEHMLLLLRNLDRKLFRLHTVCPPELARNIRPDLPPDVELVELGFFSPANIRAAARFAQILRGRKIGILHSHMFQASLAASPVGWLCGTPVTIETPHVREHWRSSWLRSQYFVDRSIARFVDRYIAVSQANADYLQNTKKLPAGKITVIANGCDLSRFDPGRAPPAELRKALGFGAGDPILVIVGRLEAQKGHTVALQALHIVRHKFSNVRLVCVGAGGLRGQLERQTRELGLTENVLFAGYQTNIPDWLALADISVLPSFYEGLPLVAIESLAAARAVVATAVDGTPEVVVNERTGLTVPPGAPDLLADAICRLLSDDQLRHSLARQGRSWVEAHFTQTRQVRQTEELYTEAYAQRLAKRS